MRKLNLVGERFGRLVVLAEDDSVPSKNVRWRCLCDCGEEHSARGDALKRGHVLSCGCLGPTSEVRLRALRAAISTHGMSRTPTYTTWQAMLERCHNPKNPKYYMYGALGVKVCERWLSFENFLADMGVRPDGHTLDRHPDPHGDYEPGNCRWATPGEQQRNRRAGLHLISFNGKTQCLTDWARETGIPREVLYVRINRNGWPVDLALTSPVGARLVTAIKHKSTPLFKDE
jgi:hypothetical protein